MKIYQVNVSKDELTSPSYRSVQAWLVLAATLQAAVSKAVKRLRSGDEIVSVETIGKLKIR